MHCEGAHCTYHVYIMLWYCLFLFFLQRLVFEALPCLQTPKHYYAKNNISKMDMHCEGEHCTFFLIWSLNETLLLALLAMFVHSSFLFAHVLDMGLWQ